MTDALRNEIQKYCRTLGDSDYLFPSRNGDKPISRVQAWNIIMLLRGMPAFRIRLGHIA